MARRIFVQVPLNLRLDSYFPLIYMSFKEDGVDTLGEVGLGVPGRVCPFWEVQVRQLGPYLAVVEFFVGFRDWSGDLGWEVVVPCEHMIQRRSALLAFPGVLLLCIGVSTRVFKEAFQLVIRRSYVFIKRLGIIPSAPWVCTV